MKQLSDNSMKKLDQLISTLDPVLNYLIRGINNKTIHTQIDIQRIRQLESAYNEFLSSSRE